MKIHLFDQELTNFSVSVDDEMKRTAFRILLEFGESEHKEAIGFEVSPEALMGIMVLLQRTQTAYELPIPSNVRSIQKPKLRVVTPDDADE